MSAMMKVRALKGYAGIKHPVTGVPALDKVEDGGNWNEWPRDQATFRIIADGAIVEVEDEKPAEPAASRNKRGE